MLLIIEKLLNIFKRKSPENEETLRELISDSKEKKIITDDEEELIDSIFDLEDTLINEIMIPRVDIVTCAYDTSIEDIIDIITKTSKSRLPVYHKKLDNIIGIVNGNDILKFIAKNPKMKAVELMRPPYFIPETKSVLSTLRELQKKKISIAIVVDEYGGVSGMVTMEDIVEEIVGELHDELDKDETMLSKLSENSYLVNAKLDLDELNELINTDFTYENINSVGGLILTELEHIPHINEKLKINGIEFIITEMIKTRIHKVIIRDLRRKNE